jgi:hypothetical protein
MAKAVCSGKNSILSLSGSVCVSAGEGWCRPVSCVRVEVQFTRWLLGSRCKPVGAELLKLQKNQKTRFFLNFFYFLMLFTLKGLGHKNISLKT